MPVPAPDNAPIIVPEPDPKRRHHKVDRTGPNWDENGEYFVGKGRPPVDRRWKPGQSGNPRGPKPSRKLTPQEQIDEEILRPHRMKVNGEEKEMTNLSLGLNALRVAAAKGQTRAAISLVNYFRDATHRMAVVEDTPEADAWEQNIVDTLLAEFGLPVMPVIRKARGDADQPSGDDPTWEDEA